MTDEDIKALAKASGGGLERAVIGTLLPSAAFFCACPFSRQEKLIDAGCAIALATDYNPGSSPSGNMNLVIAMSCIPNEDAAGRSDQCGYDQWCLCHGT